MTTQIVGLVGRKRAGKDTAAQALTDRGWRRIALADPMREFMMALDPLIAPELRWREAIEAHGYEAAKDAYQEVRTLMQKLGTEAGRNVFGESFWTDIASVKIAQSPEPVVVTDVRFLNEAAILRRQGATIVRVMRPDLGRNTDMHQSEVEQEKIVADYTIINGGTPEALGQSLVDITTGFAPPARPAGLPITG